ncbi:MAG: KamA family radical SAM protein, partial [Desulfobacteraceae bacterium]
MITAMHKDQTIEPWERMLSKSITTPEELSSLFEIDEKDINRVISRYPLAINPYYLSLIRKNGGGIYRQAVPDIREITEEEGLDDPLNEDALSPLPGITHKYPDRVLFLVSSQCAMYCRFCNRKRKVGRASMVTRETIGDGISYIRGNKKIRDVLLSGGDPLLLPDAELFVLLRELRSISHVEIIRIGTRVPCTLPQRVTQQLADMLKGFHPLYINTHFNHPAEITPEASLACARLVDAGIPLGCQTVLLKGINDDPDVMKILMQKLLAIRVRPYYLFQADRAKGTSHFWTPLEKGVEIMWALQGYTSGLCVPRFMIDLPGGGGKIPLVPEYVLGEEKGRLRLKNYLGEEYFYPLPAA